MSKEHSHQAFLKTLRKLLETELKNSEIEKAQICYDGSNYIYLSKNKPPKNIHHPAGVIYDVSTGQDPETKWWIWTY